MERFCSVTSLFCKVSKVEFNATTAISSVVVRATAVLLIAFRLVVNVFNIAVSAACAREVSLAMAISSVVVCATAVLVMALSPVLHVFNIEFSAACARADSLAI